MPKTATATVPDIDDDAQPAAAPKPDLVDSVTAYLCALVPELSQRPEVLEQLQERLREEFGGVHGRQYVRSKAALDQVKLLAQARAMLKTKSPTTVARELGISRSKAYSIRAAMQSCDAGE